MSNHQETWLDRKWRPMMAVQYMVVCIADFIVFPILFTIVQFWEPHLANDSFRQWAPLTLQNGGLYHVAMGAVLGITAWSRGQEKLAGVAGVARNIPGDPDLQNYSGRLAPPQTAQPLK